MSLLDALLAELLEPGIYRYDGDSDPEAVEAHLAELGWRGFNVDGRLTYDKQSLLEQMAGAMAFPGYVSRNWDALEEAVRDLSWASGNGFLITYDYPQVLAACQPADWQTLLAILNNAIAEWYSRGKSMVVLLRHTEAGLTDIPRLMR